MNPHLIENKIKRITDRIEDIQYEMIEAEGDEYEYLEQELQTLEDNLEDYQNQLDGVHYALDYFSTED